MDSEPIALAVLRDAIGNIGLALDPPTVQQRFQGRSLRSVVEALAEEGIEFGPGPQRAMNAVLRARFTDELRPMGGIGRVLERLALPYCVASSSPTERLHHSLLVTGLAPAFDGRVFSADQVERGKPHPDLFLLAARAMGVPPEDCLVIEDSVTGIEAARAAGMDAIAFTGGTHLTDPAARHALLGIAPRAAGDMDELARLLAEAGALEDEALGAGVYIRDGEA